MTCKFTAIPVSSGDSFLLEKHGKKIIVDGGGSQKYLRNYLKHKAKIDNIDVVVCTHNDIDHSGGILGLLDASCCIGVNEVWLPASWSYQLPSLLRCPYKFASAAFREYCENPNNYDWEMQDFASSTPEYGNFVHENCPKGENFNLKELIVQNKDLRSCDFLLKICKKSFAGCCHPTFIKLLNLAENIKKITTAAVKKGCEIRFFEYLPLGFHPQPCGGEAWLCPVNSVELSCPVTKHISPLQYLYLSESNRQSLVFYSPETEDDPGVFFSADSDLGFQIAYLPPIRPIIVTSPHHGSESCKDSYDKIKKWVNHDYSIWVRSDCKSKTRPCKEYIALNYKYCTICRTTHSVPKKKCNFSAKNPIVLSVKSGQWVTSNNLCSCV